MEERTIVDNLLCIDEFNFPKNIIGEYSPLSLAFIGDAVYEVYVRTYILNKGNMPPHKLHNMAAGFVKASSQAKVVREIKKYLNHEEIEVVKRGRNAKSGTVPKNADIIDYKNATGLESLFGYLYLSGDTKRLRELLKVSVNIIESMSK